MILLGLDHGDKSPTYTLDEIWSRVIGNTGYSGGAIGLGMETPDGYSRSLRGDQLQGRGGKYDCVGNDAEVRTNST